MGTLRIGSVIRVAEWCLVDRGPLLRYGLVTGIMKGPMNRRIEVTWGVMPRNPNLRKPRAKWFENPDKWDRCKVVRW